MKGYIRFLILPMIIIGMFIAAGTQVERLVANRSELPRPESYSFAEAEQLA
ncbi:MAG: hypothetical protein Fur005_34840 [Roseiflexaceae bacterium]